MKLRDFIEKLLAGGEIVCSAQCSTNEIDEARANGNLLVLPEEGSSFGYGYVYRPAPVED